MGISRCVHRSLAVVMGDGGVFMRSTSKNADRWEAFEAEPRMNENAEDAARRVFQEHFQRPEAEVEKRGVVTLVSKGECATQLHLFVWNHMSSEGVKAASQPLIKNFLRNQLPYQSMPLHYRHWLPSILEDWFVEGAVREDGIESSDADNSLQLLREGRWSLSCDVLKEHDLHMFLSKDIEGWREEALIQDKKLMIVGQNILLVPYSPEHVARYHEWMKDEEILKFTGSEPLSLDEEIEMQKKWEDEYDKSTFIILDKESKHMIGDINMFFYEDEKYHGEINVMIAEKEYRRKGLAKEALRLFMHYAYRRLGAKVTRKSYV
uniref:N-acetyltransferase domain-containing protein n=2 Tax=Guillardia theta TaxID=55529 RepID=A0A7S4P046_GUITH|mmetsp:Transcript_40168/g.126406  ORF Transcript_40168/g.126406 Transcript_40168/m.126406 type:complete len:321 (+) Transcript_40168:68-1030(+)